MKRTEVEDLLESQMQEAGLSGFVREYQAIEGRRFKWTSLSWKIGS